MGLKKGMTNNPDGRPAGTPNKITSDLRTRINEFLNNHWNNIEDEFQKLDTKDKLIFYEKLISYSLPKLQTVNLPDITPLDNKPTIMIVEKTENGYNEISLKTD